MPAQVYCLCVCVRATQTNCSRWLNEARVAAPASSCCLRLARAEPQKPRQGQASQNEIVNADREQHFPFPISLFPFSSRAFMQI